MMKNKYKDWRDQSDEWKVQVDKDLGSVMRSIKKYTKKELGIDDDEFKDDGLDDEYEMAVEMDINGIPQKAFYKRKLMNEDHVTSVESLEKELDSCIERLSITNIIELVEAMIDSPAFTAYLLKNKSFSEWFADYQDIKGRIVKKAKEDKRKNEAIKEALGKLTQEEKELLGLD